MSDENLKSIDRKAFDKSLHDHKTWVHSRGRDGKRADFSSYNFSSISRLALTSNGMLAGISFRGSVFEGNWFSECNCVAASFQDCTFENVNFRNCDLRAANFRDARFQKCSLEMVDVNWADFDGVLFVDTRLRGNFGSTKLEAASLRSCEVTFRTEEELDEPLRQFRPKWVHPRQHLEEMLSLLKPEWSFAITPPTELEIPREIPLSLRKARDSFAERIRSENANRSEKRSSTSEPSLIGVGFGARKDHTIGAKPTLVFQVDQLPTGKTEREGLQLPTQIEGYPTELIATGPIFLCGPDPRSVFRPVQPGCSIGPPLPPSSRFPCSGTLGALVRDRNDSTREYLLGAAHVLTQDASWGDGIDIYQPGLRDLSQADVAGKLLRSLLRQGHLNSASTVTIDAGLVECGPDVTAVKEILHLGPPRGVVSSNRLCLVEKFGRSTNHTQGQIVSYFHTVVVGDGLGGCHTYDNQILICSTRPQWFADEGDSGALVVRQSNREAVGLLVAGSRGGPSGSSAIATPIQDVLDALQVDLAVQTC